MAPDDPSGGRPAAPIVLRIKLRYDDLEAMVQRFAANVGKSGLFLPTRSMQPVGAEVKFELRLADDTPALVGLGRVKAVKPPDPHNPKAAFGMAVELMRVTPQSRALILRMLERRRELGLPEVGLPSAADIDAARRADPGDPGRDFVTGPVALVSPTAAAAPPAPAPTPPVAAAAAPVGEGLMTAPRRTTAPITVAKVAAIAPLSPEPVRRPRTAVSEIIERASGPVVGLAVAAPGLDDHVDVAAAIARARALAGGSLDAELEQLAEAAAAPLEISVEAASAELARQLGGSAVRRDRSGGWAVPPATSAAVAPVDAPGAEPASPAVEESAAATQEFAAAADAPGLAAEGPAEPAADAGAAATDELAAATGELAAATGELPAVAGELAAVAESAAPGAEGLAAAAPGTEGLAAAADDEDDAGVHAWPSGPSGAEPVDVEAGAPSVMVDHGEERAEIALDDLDGDLDGDLDDDLDNDEHTEMGEMPGAASGFELPADADEPGAGDAELAGFAPAEPPLELGVDEFDDFEIIAEADASDEDLLASHAEQDASGRRASGRRSELDFAARLDLGEDSDMDLGAPADELSAGQVIDSLQDELTSQHPAAPRARFRAAPSDARAISVGAALEALEADAEVTDDPDAYGHRTVRPIFDPDPSSSFTLAGIPSDSIDLDPPSPRAQPIEPPRPVRRHAPLSLHEAPVDDDELEHALEALDVDLDDLSIPHAATQLQRDPSRPVPGLRGPRPTPAPQPRAPQGTPTRAPHPTPAPRAAQPTPAPRPAHPTPAPRAAAATPSRAVRPTGLGAPPSGRIAAPRAPSEGVDIDFDDDD